MDEGIYAGLPAEFSPPYATAERIVNLETRAERDLLFSRIPEGWRPMIGHFAIVGLATHIVVAEALEERQRRMAEVPEEWRTEVESHVRRLWPRREELRANTWRPGRRPERSAA